MSMQQRKTACAAACGIVLVPVLVMLSRGDSSDAKSQILYGSRDIRPDITDQDPYRPDDPGNLPSGNADCEPHCFNHWGNSAVLPSASAGAGASTDQTTKTIYIHVNGGGGATSGGATSASTTTRVSADISRITERNRSMMRRIRTLKQKARRQQRKLRRKLRRVEHARNSAGRHSSTNSFSSDVHNVLDRMLSPLKRRLKRLERRIASGGLGHSSPCGTVACAPAVVPPAPPCGKPACAPASVISVVPATSPCQAASVISVVPATSPCGQAAATPASVPVVSTYQAPIPAPTIVVRGNQVGITPLTIQAAATVAARPVG